LTYPVDEDALNCLSLPVLILSYLPSLCSSSHWWHILSTFSQVHWKTRNPYMHDL